eukprot:bmy_15781T0
MSNPFLKQVFNKDKTFRPKRKFEPGTQRFELHKKAQASLNAGLDLKLAVQLPAGEELNDWVAVHVVDFFNRVNLIYGTISDGCTERSCPVMSGGPKYEYRWQDEHRFRRPTALSAPRYMDLLMDWIEGSETSATRPQWVLWLLPPSSGHLAQATPSSPVHGPRGQLHPSPWFDPPARHADWNASLCSSVVLLRACRAPQATGKTHFVCKPLAPARLAPARLPVGGQAPVSEAETPQCPPLRPRPGSEWYERSASVLPASSPPATSVPQFLRDP